MVNGCGRLSARGMNTKYRPIRRSRMFPLVAPLLLISSLTFQVGCGASGPSTDVKRQMTKVSAAEETLRQAASELEALRDSLDKSIRKDVELGMSRAAADSLEQSVVRSQEALVKAAEANLERQRLYLKALEAPM